MANTEAIDQSGKITVFIIDTNRFFRQGIRASLTKYDDIVIVGESDAGPGVLEEVRVAQPQIVLIDAITSLESGISLLHQLATHFPGVSTIVLSQLMTDEELLQATVAGTSAYVSKDIEDNQLVDVIRQTADSLLPIAQDLTQKPSALKDLLNRFRGLDLTGRTVHSTHGALTEREAEALSYVACGYSNRQVARHMGISEQTIKNHIGSILVKLCARDRTHAVVKAIDHGWISVVGVDRRTYDDLNGEF